MVQVNHIQTYQPLQNWAGLKNHVLEDKNYDFAGLEFNFFFREPRGQLKPNFREPTWGFEEPINLGYPSSIRPAFFCIECMSVVVGTLLCTRTIRISSRFDL